MKDYQINGYNIDEYVNMENKASYDHGLITGIIGTSLVIGGLIIFGVI